jgi:hypothetical protein
MAVGTTEGLFMVSDGRPAGPLFEGNHVPAFLQLGSRYYVATIDPARGAALRMSDDGGRSWSAPGAIQIQFPSETGRQIAKVCHLQIDRSSPPSSSGHFGLFAGVEPAALFRSADGETFELVRGLWDHPDRAAWGSGPEGLCLHTVLTHRERPGRIIVAIAYGGVYRSDDGGETWQSKSSGIAVRAGRARVSDHAAPVHKLAYDASGPDVIFAQAATGIYRTENAGDSWVRVGRSGKAGRAASGFGFPVVSDPVEAGTAFVFPRGRPAVYRTTDGGARWGALGPGLPHPKANVSVLGDAFTVGEGAPYPLAFGTRTGELFASLDSGESWRLLASELPPVICVRVLE